MILRKWLQMIPSNYPETMLVLYVLIIIPFLHDFTQVVLYFVSLPRGVGMAVRCRFALIHKSLIRERSGAC